jgi:hypothetical protein
MSTLPENELDLEKLFLPAWAQEPSSAKNYAQYAGGDARPERSDERRGRRPFRREGAPNERPPGGRPRGDRQGQPRPDGDRRNLDRNRSGPRREEPRERHEPPPPLPEINVSFIPDERGVESLARQIKTTGRAYPLFDIARLILQKPERYSITFSVVRKPDGNVAQPLFACALDDTLWLSEDEAVQHVLKNHFSTFYQTERTATEPPKGKYTFVAQCGLSGVVLGPPNHHDYQNQLRKLHAERFSRMPFEAFKSRVRIVRDEEVVKKWIDDQSWKTEFVCLNMPEPLRLANREAVEKHFRELHKDNIIKSTDSHTLTGTAARGLRSPELARLVRLSSEDQRRFPLQIATVLSQQFTGQGLQFFKVNRAITHVCVARPHFLDLETTPVSDGIRRIVDFINTHLKCTRRRLVEALVPAASEPRPQSLDSRKPPEAESPAAPAPAPETEPASAATAPVPSPAAPATPATHAEPTPEETAVVADLHWLIHEGHVIEFANGIIETAKKPAPKPPKPEAKAEAKSSAPVSAEGNSAPASHATGGSDLPIGPDAQQRVPAQSMVGEQVQKDQASTVEAEPTANTEPASADSISPQSSAEVPAPAESEPTPAPAAPETQVNTDTPAAPAESHS